MVDDEEQFGMIVPILKGSTKGVIKESDLERTFSTMDELIARPTVRNLLIGSDGLYEVRITPGGIFKVRLSNEYTKGAEQVSEGVNLLLPPIPSDLFLAVRNFFVRFALREKPVEVMARIYHDGQKYFAYVPYQIVTPTRIRALDYPQDIECAAKNNLVMEVHSHNVLPSEFSYIDDLDELATGLYCVWGNLDQLVEKRASLAFRYSCGGHYRDLNIFDFVKNDPTIPRRLPDGAEMERWMDKVYILKGGESVD